MGTGLANDWLMTFWYHNILWPKMEQIHTTNIIQIKQIPIISFIRGNLKINPKTVKDRVYQTLVGPKPIYCMGFLYIRKYIQFRKNPKRSSRLCIQQTAQHKQCYRQDAYPQLASSTGTQNKKNRLQMFHKIVNNKIEIPYENILVKSQSKIRFTHNQTFRQIQCNKDSYIFSFSAEQ